ncbi:MAG: hypothetical protein ACHQD9_06675, partial [Chitinophagales bacterium]
GWLNEFFSINTLSAIGNYSQCIRGGDSIKVLSNSALISANQSWNNGGSMRKHFYDLFERLGGCNTSSSTFNLNVESFGNWKNANDKFLGVRVLKDNHYYYGWVRLSVGAHSFTVKDYALNLTADSAILAGQVDCSNISSTVEISNGQSISCGGSPIELKAHCQLSIANSFQWFQNDLPITNAIDSIFIATSPGDFNYVVNYNNSCFDTSEVVALIFDALSPPIISFIGDTLFSNYAGDNQWYLNNVIIPGATDNFYVPGQSGNYKVEITDSLGCSSFSENYDYENCNDLPYDLIVPGGQTTSCNGSHIELDAEVNISLVDSVRWFRNSEAITDANNTTFIAVMSGNYNFISYYNSECIDTSISVAIVIHYTPQPIITVSNDTLFSNYSSGNHWFFNYNLISGAVYNFYVATQSGTYQLWVVDSIGCSGISSPVDIIATGIQNNSNNAITYFLDEKILHINLGEAISETQTARLVNELGVILQKISITSPEFSIDMNQYPPGIYFVMLDEGKRRSIIKFVLN